jgi:hypothetical protein
VRRLDPQLRGATGLVVSPRREYVDEEGQEPIDVGDDDAGVSE